MFLYSISRLTIIFIIIKIYESTCPSYLQNCLTCTNSTNTLQQCTACVINNNLAYTHLTLSTYNASWGCIPCYYRCKMCVSQYQCSSCQSQYYFDSNSKICVPCNLSYCMTCSANNICLNCMQGYYLSSDNSTCISCSVYTNAITCNQNLILSCANGYYVNNGYICSSCIVNCLICSNGATCNNCTIGYYGQFCDKSCATNCVSCVSNISCITCNQGYYLTTIRSCQLCKITNCYQCFSNGTCNICNMNFNLKNNACIPINNYISNCQYYINSSVCLNCKNGFYNLINQCLPCSILCSTCNGPHFGNCLSCNINMHLYNGICLPYYTLANSKYQNYITARNNPNMFTATIVQLSICNDVTVQSSKYIEFNLSNLNAYRIVITWKVYLLNATTNSSGYSVSFSNSIISNLISYGNFTNSLLLCQLSGINFVDVNSTIQNSIDTTNIIRFSSINSNIAISQVLYVASKCDSLCLVCSSFVNCSICLNSNYYIQLGECVKSCGNNYYAYAANLQCYLICPNGTYPQDLTQTCQLCHSSCSLCMSINYCISCASKYYLFNRTCVSTCPSEYFSNVLTNNCDACESPCNTCSNNTYCISCNQDFLFNGTCVKICPDLYYKNFITTTCSLCNQNNCLTCQSINKCLSCIQGYFLLNNNCLTACVNNYYSNGSICSVCEYPCNTCINSSLNCTSCLFGFLYLNKCIQNCPTSMYNSLSNLTCQNCQLSCQTCINQSFTCTTCNNQNYLYKNNCISSCPLITYADIINKICLNCIYPCEQCSSQTICLSCRIGYYFNNSCLQKCPSSYFNDITSKNCSKCSSNCKECNFINNNCTSCDPSKGLTLNFITFTCVSTCPSGFYNSNPPQMTCQPCSIQCLTCQILYSNCTTCISKFIFFQNQCLEDCPSGYYKSNLTCILCGKSCQFCLNSTNCLFCQNGYFLDRLKNYSCVVACSLQEYPNNIMRMCEDCLFPCLNCINNSYCIQCQSGILFNNSCIQSCPIQRFYNISNNSCDKCDQNCLACHNTSNNCISCSTGYFLFQNSCLQNCPIYNYADANLLSCLPCIYPCLTCNYSNSNCSSCVDQYLFQNHCVENCPLLNFNNHNTFTCEKCTQPCLNCYSKTLCIDCIQNYYFEPSSSTCLISCNKYSYSDLNYICYSCIYPCLSCSSKLYCLSCISGVLFNGICNIQCSNGMFQYYNLTQLSYICLNCSVSCINCVNSANYCLQCSNASQYIYQGQCLQQCPSYYYKNLIDRTCSACTGCCKTCQSSNLCLSCIQPYNYYNFSCYKSCPDGFYQDEVKICQICVSPCVTCQNQLSCSNCISSYYLFGNQCVSKCPDITYLYTVNNTCVTCVFPCLKCINSLTCIQCVEMYLMYVNLNYCIQGTTCLNNLFLNTINRSCVPKQSCPQEYFLQLQSRICSPSCQAPYIKLSYNKSCVASCPLDYYINAKNECTSLEGAYQNSFIKIVPIFYIKNSKLYLRLKFNKKVYYAVIIKNDSLKITLYEIYNQRNLQYTQIELQIIQTNQQYMDMLIRYENTINRLNANITFNYQFYFNIRAVDSGIPMQPDTYIVSMPFYNYYNDQQIGQGFIYIGQLISTITLIFAVGFMLKNKLCQLYCLIDYMQIIYLLKYLQILYPPNLQEFLQSFSNSHLLFTPNILNEWYTQHILYTSSYSIGPIFLTNCGYIFLLLILFVGIYVLMMLIIKLLKRFNWGKTNILIIEYLGNYCKSYKWTYSIDLVIITFMYLIFSIFKQSFIQNQVKIKQIISITISIIIVSLVLCFLGYVFKKICKINQDKSQSIKLFHILLKNQIEDECFAAFVYPINPTSKIALFWPFILIVSKFLISVLIAIIPNYPLFCLGIFTLKSIIFSLIIYHYNPYVDLSFNRILIIAEIFSGIAFTSINVIAFNYDTLSSSKKWVIGWLSLIFLLIGVLLQFFYLGWKILMSGYDRKYLDAQEGEQQNELESDKNSNKLEISSSKKNGIEKILQDNDSIKKLNNTQQQQVKDDKFYNKKHKKLQNEIITYDISEPEIIDEINNNLDNQFKKPYQGPEIQTIDFNN